MYAKPPAYLLESSPFDAVYTLAGNLAALEPGEKVAILRVRETQQRLGRLSALGGLPALNHCRTCLPPCSSSLSGSCRGACRFLLLRGGVGVGEVVALGSLHGIGK